MYVIMVYDVNVQRVAKVLNIGRQYLTWVQNSVMEGPLTQSQYQRLRERLRKVIDESEDSIIFYVLRSDKWLRRENLGLVKGCPEQFV